MRAAARIRVPSDTGMNMTRRSPSLHRGEGRPGDLRPFSLDRPLHAAAARLTGGISPAALEASVRYLAHELGPRGVRVNAISAGAVKTRAASGIEHFDELLGETMRKAPLRRTVDACEVGRTALLLASDYAAAITGEILHVDAGFHIEGMVFHTGRDGGDAT